MLSAFHIEYFSWAFHLGLFLENNSIANWFCDSSEAMVYASVEQKSARSSHHRILEGSHLST